MQEMGGQLCADSESEVLAVEEDGRGLDLHFELGQDCKNPILTSLLA